jgi:hypothetical protein
MARGTQASVLPYEGELRAWLEKSWDYAMKEIDCTVEHHIGTISDPPEGRKVYISYIYASFSARLLFEPLLSPEALSSNS